MVYVFDYPFDMEELNRKYYTMDFEVYKDSRLDYTWPTWRIAKVEDDWDYANELCNYFGIDAQPRFYFLGANTRLGPHTDNKTLCSINVILSDDNAPVIVNDQEFYYKSCLLNCQELHGVPSYPTDRRLFKLSIFNETWDQVYDKIKDKVLPVDQPGVV